jgi:hypothetical protein
MRLHRTFAYFVAGQLLWIGVAFGQSYKAESAGAPPPDVPKEIQEMLDPQGARVVSDQGATVCEMWLRKNIPTNPNPSGSSDILFGALSEGTFLGVLHFPNAATDFRNQAIKAGLYALRYALIPQDGNHMGVNPYRDALVLAPLAADKDPGKAASFDELVKLGRLGSGTPHPGFLVGAQPSGNQFPSVVKDAQGRWNLQLKAHGQGGDFPLAFTVVGKWEGP